MDLARSGAASYDGGIVWYTDMNVIGITRCVREIIPQQSRVTAFARSGQLQFCQQSISPWIIFTAENNYCWNDKRPGFYVSVTEIDRVGALRSRRSLALTLRRSLSSGFLPARLCCGRSVRASRGSGLRQVHIDCQRTGQYR